MAKLLHCGSGLLLSAELFVLQAPAAAQAPLRPAAAADTRVDASWHCPMPYLPPCYTCKVLPGAFSAQEFRALQDVKGKVLVAFTLDTLNRQLTNFRVAGAWLTERKSARRMAWQQYDESHPAPAAVAALLPSLRHYMLRKVRLTGPSRPLCMSSEWWAVPLTLL